MNSIIICYPLLLLLGIFAKKNKATKSCYVCYVLGLILLIGLRGNSPMGDYMAYYYKFEEMSKVSNWGHLLLDNSGTGTAFVFCSHFFGNYQFTIFLYSAIALTILAVWLWKYSQLPFLAMFLMLSLFYFQFSIEQYRQFTALAISVLAIYQEKKRIKLCIILLAACFHPTALIMLLLFVIPHKLYSLRIYIILLIIVFAFDIALGLLMQSLLANSIYVAERMLFYQNYAENADLEYGFITTALIIRIFLFLYLYFYRKRNIDPFTLNFYFVSILFYKIFSSIPELAARGSAYLTLVEPILICMFVSQKSIRKEKRTLFLIAVFLLSIYRQSRFWSLFDDFIYKLNAI